MRNSPSTRTTDVRTYSELVTFPDYESRFRYLRLKGGVGIETFGFDRYLNQRFYRSQEWKAIRRQVIMRDNGCDLGVPGREVHGKIVIHHMNPLSIQDISDATDYLLNPEYLITTTLITHNAIHYGDEDLLVLDPVERRPNDTCPWKR